MPRPLRTGNDGDFVHVTSRGNRRQLIYLDDADRRLFLWLLGRTVDRYEWFVYAYCLMGNHFHLVLELPRFNLSKGMQYLNGRYGQAFNERRALDGHLFGGRFASERIATDRHLAGAVRYVDLNPVRAGLVGDPGAWQWSSYCATVGLAPAAAFLAADRTRELFHRDPVRGAAAYRRFVEDAVRSGHVRGLTPDMAEGDAVTTPGRATPRPAAAA